MANGKYSPTVAAAYRLDQDWHAAVSSDYLYDAEGFDSYGYNHKDVDRAGNHEDDYATDPFLFDDVAAEWGVDAAGKPAVKVKP